MGGYDTSAHTAAQNNDYANQHNPNSDAYKANANNHSNQCNSNNDAYYASRGKGRENK